MAKDYIQDMEVSTENLANANMPGYKRVAVSRPSFSEEMARQVEKNDTDRAAGANPIVVNHEQGALRETGQPLDLAIEGSGYFVVSDGVKEYYTRNGTFHVSSNGTIVNTMGLRLQGLSGDLIVPHGKNGSHIHLDSERHVQIGKRVVGQLKLVDAAPSKLKRAGNTLFVSDKPLVEEGDGSVLSGYIEQSNATVVDEMVSMMTTMRNYESCQKMVRMTDEAERKMIGKII